MRLTSADLPEERYAIERELGRGGMASVWLARDLRHDRPVAIKVLHPELAASAGDRLTSTGLAVGTPAYMSPEQAPADPVDARTDQYSLASVLYEMLVGEPPFTGPTAQAIVPVRPSVPHAAGSRDCRSPTRRPRSAARRRR